MSTTTSKGAPAPAGGEHGVNLEGGPVVQPSDGPPPSFPGESADTALIARLVKELYSGGGSPAAAPQASSDLPGAGSSSALANSVHLPSPGAGLASVLPTPTRGDAHDIGDLGGGYPAAAPSTHPPVHPVLPSATPGVAPAAEAQPAKSGNRTPSGEHDPESADSYPFGEPRCNGTVFLKPSTPAGRGAPSASPLPGSPEAGPSLPGFESASPSGFYFIQETPRPALGVLGGPTAGRSPQSSSIPSFDISAIRRDFPALHQKVNGHPLIWLDNAATTHKPQHVIDATSRFYGRDNSNIHRAAHALAARSTDLFEAGREKVRRFLGAADAKEIIFVRGTSEGINLVAQSYGRKNIGTGDEIIITELEHHANIVPWQLLAEQTCAVIRVVPINDRGELILEEYAKLLTGRTKFVSVAHVSNSLGTINPVEQIIALAHARGVPVLVDGAQSTPHLPVNVTALDADFYVFSGHKVFGPTGIGAVYGKSALLESMPPWQGGGHMIRDVRFEKTIYQNAPEKFEAGTPDIAGVVGLGAAIDYLFHVGIPGIAAYEHALLEYATHAMATIPGLRFIGTAPSKASVLSFVIPGVPNERIAKHLDRHGIAVRAGHHCAQPAQRHFGLESTVRPSLAFYNTHEEVDTLVRVLRTLPRT